MIFSHNLLTYSQICTIFFLIEMKGYEMLLSFSVANFGSFNDKVTFTMAPGKISKQHPEHVLVREKNKALKGTAVYGANASGKTNFVKALEAFKNIINGLPTSGLLLSQFKLNNSSDMTEFEVEFQTLDVAYQYILKTNGTDIPFEQLAIIQPYGDPKPLFTREKQKIELGALLKASEDWYKNRTFQSTNAYLFKLWQDGIVPNQAQIAGAEHIVRAINFFFNLHIVTSHSMMNPGVLGEFIRHEEFKNFLKELLKAADVGITDIKWVQLSKEMTEQYFKQFNAQSQNNDKVYGTAFLKSLDGETIAIDLNYGEKTGFTLKTMHRNVEFNIAEESEGTKRLIDLAVAFFQLKNRDFCLVIDELDCHLHPMLSKFLLQNHLENKEYQGQLIVTLHDLNLMSQDIWRTDEIWFTEKRIDGSTDMYSLYQYSPRFDKNLQNGYMQGKYGAIPMIGSLENA